MSLSRIAAFIIGLILASVGLVTVINNIHDIWSLIVGGVMLVVGIWILLGLPMSI
jgi:uncharacterized membrane protein YccC